MGKSARGEVQFSPGRQFQVCGSVGLAAALALGVWLARERGLEPLVVAALWAGGVATFLALAMATKIATGVERLVCYHHQVAVTATAAGALWLSGRPVLPYMDIVAAGLGAFLTFGRIGCLRAGCCHGRPARAGAARLPVQAMEAAAALALTGFAAWLMASGAAPGTAFAAYAAGYAAARFVLEFLRGDAGRRYGLGFSEAQWTSLIVSLAVPPVAAGIGLAMLAAAWVHRRPEVRLASVHTHAERTVQPEAVRPANGAQAQQSSQSLLAMPPERGHSFSRLSVVAGGRPLLVQRAAELPGAEIEAESSGGALIVEDDATDLSAGQMAKSVFLDALREALCTIAEEEVGAVCPGIDQLFATYGPQPAADIESAVRRYVSGASLAASAGDYIPLIGAQVRRAIGIWKTTREVTGIPPEFAAGLPVAPPGPPAGSAAAPETGASLKGRDLQPRAAPGSPRALERQLGGGTALDGSVQARLGPAMGMDLSRVRIHTDSDAARLSSGLDARAFTVGRHIAFAPGEYRPGTLVGDALLAHELAHVAQQSGSSTEGGGDAAGYAALEEEADRSAVGAVASLWDGAREALKGMGERAVPALKSGLRLQRCTTTSSGPIGTTREAEAFANFQKENDHLTATEFAKINSALSKTTGDNHDLIISFYDYFSNHEIIKDSAVGAKGLDGETSPHSDMHINPPLLEPSTSDTRLGGTLLHEYSHTRHESAGMGFGDFQEGDSYGIEYFFAERNKETDRMHVIEALVTTPGKLTLPTLHESMVLRFKESYATMLTLYDVIDGKQKREPVANLTPDEAKRLAARFVDTHVDHRDSDLQNIVDWVKNHFDQFVFIVQ